MQYKTILLELVKQRPALHRELRARRRLLPAINRYAAALKRRHAYWIGMLGRTQPGSAPEQLASQALELAMQEIRDALPHGSSPNGVKSPTPCKSG